MATGPVLSAAGTLPARTVHLIESAEAARHPARPIEDAMTVTPSFAAVFDGVTSLDPPDGTLITPGFRAVQGALDAMNFAVPGSKPAELVQLLHAGVARARESSEPSGCVAAVLDAAAGRVVRVGDVSVLVDGVLYPARTVYEDLLAEQRAEHLRALIELGRTVPDLQARDLGRAAIEQLLHLGRRLWNRIPDDPGVGVLDGTSTPDSLIDVIDVSRAVEVVLATDGYPDPRPTLDASEAALADRLRTDPLMIADPPKTKGLTPGARSFDDRLYLRVGLRPANR